MKIHCRVFLPLIFAMEANSEAIKLEFCPLGQFKTNFNTTSACKNCPAGKYRTANHIECKQCPAGKFQAALGKSNCNNCNPGKHQNEPGKSFCNGKLCTPGKFLLVDSPVTPQTCKNCSGNQFQDEAGASRCKQCPAGMQSQINRLSCNTMSIQNEQFFPGFTPTNHAFFASGIGPLFASELLQSSNKSVQFNSVQVLEFFDGAAVNEILRNSEAKLAEIKVKNTCSKTCANGILDTDNCQCQCFDLYSQATECSTCEDTNADPDDHCQSCLGNFRKNTLNKCTLCKFGFTGSSCSQCLPDLDIAFNCQRSKCANPVVKGFSEHARSILAWDANNEVLFVENNYAQFEGIIPSQMRNTFVSLHESNILMFLSSTHRHLMNVSGITNASLIQESWWIWTIPSGDVLNKLPAFKTGSNTTQMQNAAINPVHLLYQVVCSHYDSTKYVLAAYTKHRYTGNATCSKIESALLQKIPLAQTYTNAIPRTISNDLLPNPGCNKEFPYKLTQEGNKFCFEQPNGNVNGGNACRCSCEDCSQTKFEPCGPSENNGSPPIACGTKTKNDKDCSELCETKLAWTYSTISSKCLCYDELPFVTDTAVKKHTISGGIMEIQSAQAKKPHVMQTIAFLDSEVIDSFFAETPLVCCSRCKTRNTNFYLRDGFNCRCLNIETDEINGENECESENTILETSDLFFGRQFMPLQDGKHCNRQKGCVKHGNSCVKIETVEQSDEIQFSNTGLCSAEETKYVKLYQKSTNNNVQLFEADGCDNLQWKIFDKPILNNLNPGKTLSHDTVLPNRVFVPSADQEIVTTLELSQKISTLACDEAIGLAAKKQKWETNTAVQNAVCFGNPNCPVRAQTVSNEIITLQKQEQEARLRCKLIQQSFAETDVLLTIKQCGPGKNPPLCSSEAVVTPNLTPRLFTESPTPAPVVPDDVVLNNGCDYIKTKNATISNKVLRKQLKVMGRGDSLTHALDDCTFHLLCSHVEENQAVDPSSFVLFTHVGFSPEFKFDRGTLISEEANKIVYFKDRSCLFAT